MGKKCPECGSDMPVGAKFCQECGYSFYDGGTSKNGNYFMNNISIILFLIIIIIAVIGANFLIFNSGIFGSQEVQVDNVTMDITEVGAYKSSYGDGSRDYTYYVNAIFTEVPDNLEGYNIKTTYYDENNTELGQSTETLSFIHPSMDFWDGISYYTTKNVLDVDHVKVQVVKDNKIINEYNAKFDENKNKINE